MNLFDLIKLLGGSGGAQSPQMAAVMGTPPILPDSSAAPALAPAPAPVTGPLTLPTSVPLVPQRQAAAAAATPGDTASWIADLAARTGAHGNQVMSPEPMTSMPPSAPTADPSLDVTQPSMVPNLSTALPAYDPATRIRHLGPIEYDPNGGVSNKLALIGATLQDIGAGVGGRQGGAIAALQAQDQKQAQIARLQDMAARLNMSPAEALAFQADPAKWAEAVDQNFGFHTVAGGDTALGYGGRSFMAPKVGVEDGRGYMLDANGLHSAGTLAPSYGERTERAKAASQAASEGRRLQIEQQNADTTRSHLAIDQGGLDVSRGRLALDASRPELGQVVAGIVAKKASGAATTPGEDYVLDWYNSAKLSPVDKLLLGGPGGGNGAPAPAPSDGVPVVTPQQAAALPKGSKFRTTDGRLLIRQ